MSIGYACLTVEVPNTNYKSCILKNASEERLISLIDHNLNSLENIIDYNIRNNIKLYRITSDLIPFGSNPVNKLEWWNIFKDRFEVIEKKIKISNIRVSMHPGQYTVLNSPREDVVGRAIDDLIYHTRVLDSLNVPSDHKIILHIGGVYGDKKQAINRFMYNYQQLDKRIKDRLVIENDDRSYNMEDVLYISSILEIPVVFDNLHHRLNHIGEFKNDNYFIEQAKKTWGKSDGRQKIHYSQQDPLKSPGAHSESIDIDEFFKFYNSISNKDLDIMLEVKDKNISAINCISKIEESK